MIPICFYHSADLDGFASGAIVYRLYNRNIDMYPINYHHEFPMDLVVDREVVMVDFSVGMSLMKEIKEKASKFIWIDHHETAIDAAQEAAFTTDGLRRVGEAGCELTWQFFHSFAVPLWVTLLGRYDVWDQKNAVLSWEDQILPFQYGVRNHDPGPMDTFWDQFFLGDDPYPHVASCGVHALSTEGSIILGYQRKQDETYVKTRAFEATFLTPSEGYRAIACNVARANSDFFRAVYDPEKHDIMISFGMTQSGAWSISLRSAKPEVHCGQIAQCFGGGGHAGAAGFTSVDLSFLRLNNRPKV